MKKFKLLYTCFLLFGLCPLCLADSAPLSFEEQLLPEDVEKTFFDRLNDGRPLFLKMPVQKLPEEIKVSDVWLGNRPYMKSSVENVRLKFSKAAEGAEPGGAFDIDLEFLPDGIVIKHSNPEYNSERGGLRLGNDRLQKVRKFFVRGKNKQSLAVFAPAFAPSEKSRGLFMCPRDFFSKGTREEKSSLQYSGYNLNSASGEVNAEMNAYLNNPIDFVLAEAKILTSPGVKPPVNNYDRNYAKDAGVALLYKPKDGEALPEFQNYSNFTLGIENFLSLHFSSGYKRISRQYAAVYVKEITAQDTKEIVLQSKDIIGTEMETELKLRKIPVNNQALIGTKVKPGGCYLVLYRVLPIIHEYLKEDFVPPSE